MSYLVRKTIDHFISRPTIITYYGCPCPDLKRPCSKMAEAKSTIDAHVGCNRVLYVTNGEEQLKYESVRGFVGTKKWTIIRRLEESDRIKHLEDKFNGSNIMTHYNLESRTII